MVGWVEEGNETETKVTPSGSCGCWSVPDKHIMTMRDPIFYVPVVPKMDSRRMPTTRLCLFQRTTARQAQIISLRIY